MCLLDSAQTIRSEENPLRRKELGQNRLAGQGMAESEPPVAGLNRQQLGLGSPTKVGDHPGLVLAFDHVGQQAPVETPAEHRRRSQEFPYARHRRDPSANGLSERHGNSNTERTIQRPALARLLQLTGLHHRREQLFDQERQAVGPRHQRLDQRGGNGQAAQTARGDRRNLVRGQSSKLQKGNRAPSGQVVDTRQGERGFLVAKRDQAQDRLVGYVVGQILDDLNRVGIRPVQILQHEHTADAGVHRGEHPEHGLAQHDDRYLPRRLAGEAPLRNQSAQNRPKRSQLRGLWRSRPAQVGEHRLGQWSKSIRAVAPDSATDQHRDSSGTRIRGSLPNQARLADTCLAEDHQRRAVTRGQAIEGGSQHPQLLVATHEHRAQQLRHASEHATSARAARD